MEPRDLIGSLSSSDIEFQIADNQGSVCCPLIHWQSRGWHSFIPFTITNEVIKVVIGLRADKCRFLQRSWCKSNLFAWHLESMAKGTIEKHEIK